MKRILPIFLTALLAFSSCEVDPQEFDKRNKELDLLEQEVLKTREELLLRVKNLRTTLEDLIAEVQASLLKSVEDGENAVLVRMSREITYITPRIQKGFAKVSAYIDQQKSQCYDYSDNAFSDLGKTRDAIAAKVAQAAEEGDYRMATLLSSYDKEVERVMSKAQRAQAAIHTLDDAMGKAGQLVSLVENASTKLIDLDSRYTEMEQMQLDLMEAIKERTTDENSLKVIQDEHLRDLLLYAESLLGRMEDNKTDIQGFQDEADDVLSQIEDLESFIENDIIDGVGGALADARDAYEQAADILDFFEDISPSDMYEEVDDAISEANEAYDNIIAYMDEVEDAMDDFLSYLFDTDLAIDDYRMGCSDEYHEAENKYDELSSYL